MDERTLARVTRLVADYGGMEQDDVYPATELADLLDSLDRFDLALELEVEFDIDIDEGRLEGFRTVQELVEYVDGLRPVLN